MGLSIIGLIAAVVVPTIRRHPLMVAQRRVRGDAISRTSVPMGRVRRTRTTPGKGAVSPTRTPWGCDLHGDIPGWSPCLGERVRVKRTNQFGIVAQITDGWDSRLYVIELEGTSGAPVPAVRAASGAGDGRATYVLEELERGE